MNKIFSKNILSIIRRSFFVLFIFLFVFNFKAEARILVDNSAVPGLSDPQERDVDILYTNNQYDMAWDLDEDTHGTEKLSSTDTAKVTAYLDNIYVASIQNFSTLETSIITALGKRPDITLTQSVAAPYGGVNTLALINPLPTANTTQQTLIDTIKNDDNYNRLIFTFIQAINVYKGSSTNSGAYKHAMVFFAKMTDSQIDYTDFDNFFSNNLGKYIMKKYLNTYKNYINNNTTPTGIQLKARTTEMTSLVSSNLPNSSNVALDANGLAIWFIGSSNNGDQVLSLDSIIPDLKTTDLDTINKSTDFSSTQVTDIVDNAANAADNATPTSGDCDASSFMSVVTGGSECYIIAYVINGLLSGLNQMLGAILNMVGSLFGWIFKISIINFNDWVVQSNAVSIYKTIFLSLITSLLLPLVFYMIIRMLIDDDTSNIQKLLPKVLFTALFVYFSFGITGWIIDQSNIISIYIYRSMTHMQDGEVQSIGKIMQTAMGLRDDGSITQMTTAAQATWTMTPYVLGQLIVNVVAMFVLIQGAVLIFTRSIVLFISMIFSPLMILPSGIGGSIGGFIDNWKGKLIKYFTDNLLLGPIFMFLVFVAVKIGSAASSISKTAPAVGGIPNGGTFLSGIISTIIVVVLLQLALTVSKQLSTEIGGKVSSKINSFAAKAGGAAAGVGKMGINTGKNAVMSSTQGQKFAGWIDNKSKSTKGVAGMALKSFNNNVTSQYKSENLAEDHTKKYTSLSASGKADFRAKLEKKAGKGDKAAETALTKINDGELIKKYQDDKLKDKADKYNKNKEEKENNQQTDKKEDKEKVNNTDNSKTTTTNPTQNSNTNNTTQQNTKKDSNNNEKSSQKKGNTIVNGGQQTVSEKPVVNNEERLTDSIKRPNTDRRDSENQKRNATVKTDNLHVQANNINILVSGNNLLDRAKNMGSDKGSSSVPDTPTNSSVVVSNQNKSASNTSFYKDKNYENISDAEIIEDNTKGDDFKKIPGTDMSQN